MLYTVWLDDALMARSFVQRWIEREVKMFLWQLGLRLSIRSLDTIGTWFSLELRVSATDPS